MNRHERALVDALERQGIAVDLAALRPRIRDNLSQVRLRFDKVALRFVDDMRSALHAFVPDGMTLVFTITAPIRLASKTAALLEDKMRGALARRVVHLDLGEINGNQIRVRLVRGVSGGPGVIGFVHNPDCDTDGLFRATQMSLGRIDAASMMEEKEMKKSGVQKSGAMKSAAEKGKSPSQLIDARIRELGDWRGEMLKRARALVKEADPQVVETWKWRGVPVWEHDGIICTGETYKNVVKLTFARGAALKDPARLFNSSLEGNVRRAIDFHEGDRINEKALKDLVRAAVALNTAKGKK